MHLARELAARGVAVDLVVGSADGPRRHDVDPAVRLVDLGCKRFRWVLPSLVRYLRREKPSVMLSFLSQANLVAIAARIFCDRPGRLVISERNNLSRELQSPDYAWIRLLPPFMRRLYPKADALIAVSHGVADDLVGAHLIDRDRIVVIHNPVDASRLRSLANEEVDHPWLTGPDSCVILGVGRLVPQKDFRTLVEAVSLIDRECRLIILGDGPERDALESFARDLGVELLLPGYVRNPYSWMVRADVVALSSIFEGFPNVLVEALALGRPVVSTDCDSGPSEILDNGRIGRLVPVGDAEAMAGALIDVLAKPPSASLLKQRTTLWDPDLIVDQYEAVLFETKSPGS